MNDYRFTDPELSACIERIVTLYTYDTSPYWIAC